MDKFIGTKISNKEKITSKLAKSEGISSDLIGLSFIYYEDDSGRDWYATRDEWEKRGNTAVGISKNTGMVCSFSTDIQSFAVNELFDIYEINAKDVPETDPMKLLGFYTFDGENFSKIEEVKPVRTKEDIMADLIKLQEELKNM